MDKAVGIPGGKDGLMFLLHLLLVDHGMVKSIENELESRLESPPEYTHHLGPDGNVGESQSHFQTLSFSFIRMPFSSSFT